MARRGGLVAWGSGWRGQLGSGRPRGAGATASGLVPLRLPVQAEGGGGEARRVRLACGPSHTLALLLRPERRRRASSAKEEEEEEEEGKPSLGVWVWGRNCSGQLGLGDTHDRSLPAQLANRTGRWSSAQGGASPEEEAAVDGGAGSYHTVLATEGGAGCEGRVYACGRGRRGQTGLGTPSDSFHLSEIHVRPSSCAHKHPPPTPSRGESACGR